MWSLLRDGTSTLNIAGMAAVATGVNIDRILIGLRSFPDADEWAVIELIRAVEGAIIRAANSRE